MLEDVVIVEDRQANITDEDREDNEDSLFGNGEVKTRQPPVRLKIIKSPRRRSAREGQVLESLGHIDEPGTDVRVVSHKYELAIEFPEQVISAAEALPTEPDPAEAQRRERFDDPAPVTIDGETAQDFDDAIAVQELPRGGFRLFVHIADVAHYVPQDGTLDVEARRRGTSVYFPGTVLPMFPPTLSNGLCSLRPGEQRLVQSVILDLSARGEVRKVRFADGIIRSAARLNYTQVAAALQGKPTDRPLPASVLGMIEVADRLRELLERRRHARGSIDFDLPEPQILLDVEGVMTGIVVEPRNHAHRMIEEFMLVTNEAVASHLEGKNTACMYRVHDSPDPTKLSALARFVEGFGLQLNTDGETIEPGQIQRMLDRAQGRPEYRVISQVTLRSMRQARYTPENTGHFGLASPAYAHFTSPIRRYPDLVVHRQLRATRRGRPGRSESSLPLADVAESSSTLERNAEAAERELLVWKKVAFIAGSIGDEFDGIVTGVVRFGLFVQLVDNLVEGLVRVELLGEEWFEFDEGRFELRGTDSDKVYRLGDRIRVRVDRVDRPLLRVDFSPVQVARTGAPAGRGARGRTRKRGKSSAR